MSPDRIGTWNNTRLVYLEVWIKIEFAIHTSNKMKLYLASL